MSKIVTTEYGTVRIVEDGPGQHAILLEVPGCGKMERLGDDQLSGDLSVNHAAWCDWAIYRKSQNEPPIARFRLLKECRAYLNDHPELWVLKEAMES
jgi:hypothetical protein